jgi:hypothetical protein
MIPLVLTVAIAAVLAYDVFVSIIDPDGDYLPSIGF